VKTGSGLSRNTPLSRTSVLEPGPGPARKTRLRSASPRRAAEGPAVKSAATRKRPETGFSRSVKLKVRTRAGNGDPDKAMCEACGLWLGRRHGQVHHIIGRGMGGCKGALLNSPANAALLCGTPYAGCHGLATALDREIGARGFWLPQGTDPRTVPMMLASEHGSGVLVWRTEAGTYSFEAPEGAVA